ncbi:OLC1v1000719C1 [Oldenlandia corymbosa var. corymbosa]|uniref:OLC1v1000719C1 n=1 Tax=Oldenlandia corymbosa var. corymbosa TaxID=529605 RepID=A0AAV1D625_OLDCO|nr:OLC1v1000719C1 [Oldenlandia corymbosa var. corymbosa]
MSLQLDEYLSVTYRDIELAISSYSGLILADTPTVLITRNGANKKRIHRLDLEFEFEKPESEGVAGADRVPSAFEFGDSGIDWLGVCPSLVTGTGHRTSSIVPIGRACPKADFSPS